jgi:DNA-binding response OmpR family regulator
MRDLSMMPEETRIEDGTAVLCVDDEPRVLSALERTLRREPYDFIRAGGGAEALDLLERFPIKVIVTDERMPGMCGTELLARVRGLRPAVGRIILTGYPGPGVTVRGLEVGIDFLMTKPWNEDTLRKAIRALLQEVDRAEAEGARPPEPWLDLGGEAG